MARKADLACGSVGGIVVKHTFKIDEPLSFTEAMKRAARALTRIGSPAAEVANVPPSLRTADQGTRQTEERRLSSRRARWGRRREDRVAPIDETPRVLLIEPDQETRLLYACLFEEAGYAVYAAAERTVAIDDARGRLPDVVVMELAGPGADGEILRQWGEDPLISSIPIVVVASLLHFDVPARAPGAISVLGKPTGPEFVLAEVDKLISATPRERLVVRQLKRSLLMLRQLGQRVKPDEGAQERVRSLIDRLQVAVLALDTEGHYVAVSRGAATLTGYSRAELIGKSIFDTGLALNTRVSEGWQEFVARKQSAAKSILLDRSGNVVSIQTEFATILPGLHAAAFAD
jgi:DNA-binding response OmpR family regulator